MTPEEIELNKKHRLLDRLSDRLADAEEEMADLRGRLDQFEARYTTDVARLYAEFDEIEAEIAEEEYKLVPDDEDIKRKAEELRRQAEESAKRAAAGDEKRDFRFDPTPEAKKAYHSLARLIHPDLAVDSAEKEKRHGMMAELNQAYSAGDQAKLDRLTAEFHVSPDVITGDTLGDQLVRAIRQIAQVRARLKELKNEQDGSRSSELYELMQRAQAEREDGRDLLAQMAARTRVHITKSRRRLLNLRSVNKAAEDYVKEEYGLDISDFRDPGKNR
ncbi:MAG: J domain-containing protein [Pyrinomonadaceae bacterium]